MGTLATPPANAQRARAKAPDLSELFRSTHGSRHSSRAGADTGSNSSPNPSPAGKSAGTKAPSRRSMLPFLGRRKAELPTVPTTPMPRKSINAIRSVPTVNTVRRSFGNGHAVLMITPATNGFPPEPPLPSELPSVDAHSPSLGSKLAAHFTPLRSPSRGSKIRHPTTQKSAPPSPPVPSPTALSPPVPEIRTPSIESHHSGIRSRSATPRPLRVPHSPAAQNGYEEDFSDLFTLPDRLKMPQSPKSPSTTSVHIHLGDTPKMSGELTPTISSSSGPPLQFPIPPSTIIPPRPVLTGKGSLRYSSELASLSSQGSRSPSKRPSPLIVDGGSTRSFYSDFSSQDERRSTRYRTTSISGSDTDTSRANDSTYSTSSFRLAPASPKSSGMKPKPLATRAANVSSGPPPSLPLPSPPHSPNSPNFGGLGPRSAPIPSPNRVAFPRPRANTLSVTSNLPASSYAVPKSTHPLPPRSARANSDVTPEGAVDELREALAQQRRKNVQLQEYIVTITKRYEDDRTAMRRTIEKLERDIRKKTREIEGLRWLVIHNGAVSDIDAAANLARSSLSTQDSHASDAIRGPLSSPIAPPQHNGPRLHQTTSERQGTNTAVVAGSSTSDVRSDTSNTAASLSIHSVSETTPSTAPSLSTSERMDGISRTDRQKLKEERRASKALRRISAVSNLVLGVDPLIQSPVDSPLDPSFDPKRSMDEVLEKLQPFRHT